MAKESSFLQDGNWDSIDRTAEFPGTEGDNGSRYSYPVERILNSAFLVMREHRSRVRSIGAFSLAGGTVDTIRQGIMSTPRGEESNDDLRTLNWWGQDVFRWYLFNRDSGVFITDPVPLPWLVWGPALVRKNVAGEIRIGSLYNVLSSIDEKLGIGQGGSVSDKESTIYNWQTKISEAINSSNYKNLFRPVMFGEEEGNVAASYSSLANSAYASQLGSIVTSVGSQVKSALTVALDAGDSAMSNTASSVDEILDLTGTDSDTVNNVVGDITKSEFLDSIITKIKNATETAYQESENKLRSALGRLNLVSSSAYGKALGLLASERMAMIKGEAARIVAGIQNQVLGARLMLLRDKIMAAINMYGRGHAVASSLLNDIINNGAGAYLAIRHRNAQTYPTALIDLATQDMQVAVHHLNHVSQSIAGRIGVGKDLFELSRESLQSAAVFQDLAETSPVRRWRPLLEALPGLGGATIIPDKPSGAQMGFMGAMAGAYLGISLLSTFMGKNDKGEMTFFGKSGTFPMIAAASTPLLLGLTGSLAARNAW